MPATKQFSGSEAITTEVKNVAAPEDRNLALETDKDVVGWESFKNVHTKALSFVFETPLPNIIFLFRYTDYIALG